MPRLSGYRSTPPDLAERMLERLDAGSESTCDAKSGCDRPGFCVVAAKQRSRSQGRISCLPPLNAIVGGAKANLLPIRFVGWLLCAESTGTCAPAIASSSDRRPRGNE